MSDDPWQLFLLTLNPDRLERERFGTPGTGERPGSPQDRRMRAEHEQHVAGVRAAREKREAHERLAILTAAFTEYDRRQPKPVNDVEPQIAAYAAQKRAQAQNRKAS